MAMLQQVQITASAVTLQFARQWRSLAPRRSLRDEPWTIRRVVSLPNVLTLLWIIILYWGESWTYSSAIAECDWRHWEKWPQEAIPHHLAFVADPQIVDPHTYPSRPWPLTSLTYRYTDLYMTRVYTLMQQNLYPDTTIFLGDLFDGGREWGTVTTKSPEKKWEKYDHRFWLREFIRFSNMFTKIWSDVGVAGRVGQPERRKLLLTLPGNHDLGFADGVSKSVRNRFYAYFGEGNRVDVIGNHTFVSIDGLSLSAKAKAGEEMIAAPPTEFLADVKKKIKAATSHELQSRKGEFIHSRFSQTIVDTSDLPIALLPTVPQSEVPDLPTVLLTHVPLFRDRGRPCGPLREHFPPSKDAAGQPLEIDEHNAIPIEAGHQYQNVLSVDVSKEITEKIGNIRYAFSGDDHDYCDVIHRGYPSDGGGIREVTVKSLSWAMGVRRPGFVMLSMWNPIDEKGNAMEKGHLSQETVQSHLCLLPDQLSIFIRYGILLVFTLSALLLRAGHLSLNPAKSGFAGSESPLLPTANKQVSLPDKMESYSPDDALSNSSTASSSGGLSARLNAGKYRSGSPGKRGGYGLPSPSIPLISQPSYFSDSGRDVDEETGLSTKITGGKTRRLKGLRLFHAELRWSLIRVVLVVAPWYLWLLWTS